MPLEYSAQALAWLIPLIIWDLIWKCIALWKAGRNDQVVWFVVLFILSTAGILPIIYIFFFQDKKKKSFKNQKALKAVKKIS